MLRRAGSGFLPLSWTVEIDGARLTRPRPVERRLPVGSGRQTLILRAGDGGSLPLVVSLAPGETAVIEATTMKRAAHPGLVKRGFVPDPLLLRRIG